MAEVITSISERIDEIVDIANNAKAVKDEQQVILNFLNDTPDIKFVAANQLGLKSRMFCLAYPDETVFYMNPMIVHQEGIHASIEEDICLPGRKFMVARNDSLEFDYQDIYGRHRALKVEGFMAEVIKHAIDLLDGVTIEDIGMEVFDDYFEASEDEQKEVINLFFETLAKKTEEANIAVETDPELKKQKEAMDFYTAVARGDVKLADKELSNRKKKLKARLERRLKHLGKNFTKKKKKPRKKRV